MRKLRLTFLVLLMTRIMNAQSYSGPESAEFDFANNRWLISNTTSHQVLARDSSGTLTVFVTGLSSGPYGIEIAGDTLFCCCGSAIKGFLLSTGVQVFNLNVGATFLNGITHDNSGNLFTTDFTGKTIYKINISAQTDTMVASGLVQSPNGIIFDPDNNRCVFVNWGANAPVKAIDLSSFAVTVIIPTTLSNCDGVTRDGQGRYYVTDWGNQSVVRYDSSFSLPYVTVASSLNNPADIFYNTITDTLAIPNAGNNTVTFLGFSTVSVPETDGKNSITLFPDPAVNFLNLSFDNEIIFSEIEIVDLTGRTGVSQKSLLNGNDLSIDISDLIPGIYFLRMRIGEKDFVSKRFIKL